MFIVCICQSILKIFISFYFRFLWREFNLFPYLLHISSYPTYNNLQQASLKLQVCNKENLPYSQTMLPLELQ